MADHLIIFLNKGFEEKFLLNLFEPREPLFWSRFPEWRSSKYNFVHRLTILKLLIYLTKAISLSFHYIERLTLFSIKASYLAYYAIPLYVNNDKILRPAR